MTQITPFAVGVLKPINYNIIVPLISVLSVLDDHSLNTSDHLAVSKTIEVSPVKMSDGSPELPRITWSKTSTSQFAQEYEGAVGRLISPLLNNFYRTVAQIEQEIDFVTLGINRIAVCPCLRRNAYL